MTTAFSNLQPPTSTIASVRPLRIGYVIWSLGLGGAEQVVIRLATECARRGHQVSVLTLNRPGLFAEGLQKAGIPVISVGKRGPFDLGVIGRLAKEFRTRKLDVVHTHLWGANFWGRLAARRARIPVVVATEHNVDTWKRFHHFLLDRLLLSSTTHLIAVSHQVRQFYEARGVGLGRWRVIYNGIDTDQAPARGRGRAYRALGIGADEPVVGLVGRLVPAKAPAVFLEAVAIASRTVPALRALIVGDGPLRPEVETQVRRLGLTQRVQMPGIRQDVPELLAGMDVLAFSSEREGLSMAMLEAMATGVPVVATRVGGTPELITSGITGLLVSSGSAHELAEGILDVLQHPARAEALRRAARARVKAQFTLRAMVDQHEALYAAAAPPSAVAARRVCYVIDHLDIGGAQRQLVELVKRMPRQTWEPIVIALSTSRRTLGDELAQAGVTVHYIPQGGVLDARCLKRLTRLLRLYRPAIVHTFLFTADTYGRIAARLAGVGPVICAIRNTVDDMPRHHRLVNRWLAGWTSYVTVNADAERRSFVAWGGIPDAKIRTIYNGIDVPTDVPSHNGAYRREWNIPERAPVVAMIARLAPQKDHRTFLEAAQRVARAVPDAQFLLVGDGPRRAQVEQWVAELGLADRARLLGERRDVRQLLNSVDVCVLATHFEGCSNTLMEAMAAARPVVATNVGGNPELVVDGVTGFLVPPKDPDALGAAIQRLLTDKASATAMGIRGRARMAEQFSMDAAWTKTAALYTELLNQGARSRHVG